MYDDVPRLTIGKLRIPNTPFRYLNLVFMFLGI
jgi:hypothetical protein